MKKEDDSPLVKEERKEFIIALDGGYGWIILAASFLSAVIVDGVCLSFAIFQLEFLDHFKENKYKTAWIGSVLNGTYMIMGPVAAALAKQFGCRAVAIAGSIWSATAFIISIFSTNVNQMIFTFGVLGGMGFGLIYLPAIVIVGYYFDKRRAFATGIATCGSGIGAIIFAPFLRYLMNTYAWKGATLIVAGLVLNGMILGCLYRPLTLRELEYHRRKLIKQKLRKAKTNHAFRDKISNILHIADGNKTVLESEKKDVQFSLENGESENHNSNGHVTIVEEDNDDVDINLHPLEENHVNDDNHINKEIHTRNGNLLPKTIASSDYILRENKVEEVRYTFSMGKLDLYNTSRNGNELRKRSKSCQDYGIKITDSWHGLANYASLIDNLNHSNSEDSLEEASSIRIRSSNKFISFFQDVYHSLKETMDFNMLKNPVFLVYCFSCILSMAGFFIPFIYLPAHCIEMGFDGNKDTFLLSIMGFANTIGRIAAGWLSDRPWADCLYINNIALIIGGIATIACPYYNSYPLLMAYSLVFGVCIACFVALRSIILVDLIGLEKLTSAFGIVVLCQGISSFVGSPVAGSLYDARGTYDLSFYAAGSTIALAGLMGFSLKRIAKWQNDKKEGVENGELPVEVDESEIDTNDIP